MMATDNDFKNGWKAFQITLSTLVAIGVLLGAWNLKTAADNGERLAKIEANQANILTITMNNTARLSVVELKQASHAHATPPAQVEKRLDGHEVKLDAITERLHRLENESRR